MWSLTKALIDLAAAIRDDIASRGEQTVATRRNTSAVIVGAHVADQLSLSLEINTVALDRANELLSKLLDRLRNLPDPGPLTLSVTSEEENMLKFRIQLPSEPDGADIASGELTVKIGDDPEQTIATTKGQTEVADLRGAQGARVSASFVYIDDAGNRSEHPSQLTGVELLDTIPPPDAGALGIQVTGEEPDQT
jgi:hypothetical protein